MQDEFHISNMHAAEDQEQIRALLENVKQSESIIDGEALTPEDMTVNLLKHQRLGLAIGCYKLKTPQKKGVCLLTIWAWVKQFKLLH